MIGGFKESERIVSDALDAHVGSGTLLARRREDLKLLITTSFEDSDGTYGYRRVHADLSAWGVACGPELVRDLMRELDLQACQPRHGATASPRTAARPARSPIS
ncbi:IS3 family transposase [Streptomyces sioyaensis]|uniref:IS3 family transposase n=1 Tax=Streptomyces sioyaensis TaxID=67364 RepID=UPI0037D2A5AF